MDAGYFAPAAVVIGSVLEDGLRKICVSNSIELPEKPKLDAMNSALAKAGVYNTLTQKKVTALADIRNSAAHGKWAEFDKSDVEVTLHDGVLTLRGEKKLERKGTLYNERWEGVFERDIPVGDDIDPDKVKATFKNGVLTIALSKKPEAQREVKRITIN